MKTKYWEVYEALKEQINELQPGDKIASEVAISRQLEVSPMTVRRALSLLAQEGHTKGIPGKGTFVLSPVKKPNPMAEEILCRIWNLSDTYLLSASWKAGFVEQLANGKNRERLGEYQFVQLHQDSTMDDYKNISVITVRSPLISGLLSENLNRPIVTCIRNVTDMDPTLQYFSISKYDSHLKTQLADRFSWVDWDSLIVENRINPGLVVDFSYSDENNKDIIAGITLLSGSLVLYP